jgi:hypothetical protein
VEKYDTARQTIDGGTQQTLPLTFVIRKNYRGKNFEINVILSKIVNVLQLPLSGAFEWTVKMFTYLPVKFEAMFITTLVV